MYINQADCTDQLYNCDDAKEALIENVPLYVAPIMSPVVRDAHKHTMGDKEVPNQDFPERLYGPSGHPSHVVYM